MKNFIKRDCIYYDYGDTAPREYGAFCSHKGVCLTKTICKSCKLYKKKVKTV